MKITTLERPIRAALILSAIAFPIFAQVAVAPDQLSVFASAPTGLSAPDSIAVLGDSVFVGFGDGHAPDGSDNKSSQVVQFDMSGKVLSVYTVPGHNDGLKVDPSTHLLWALQNEDANPNLVIINPQTHQQKQYSFGPTPHGGGYDDIVFRACKVYISASNPAKNPNTGPAIVSADLDGSKVDVTPVLAGNASAINITSDQTVTLNLQDPDSMTLDPFGNIVLDSQADQQLIIVSNPSSPNQRVLQLPLTLRGAGVEVDDTAFVTSSQGFILFADKGLNKVFMLNKKAFAPGSAFTAADGASLVGTIDLTTGAISPIVTGLSNPGGLVFVNTSPNASAAVESHCGDQGDDNQDN